MMASFRYVHSLLASLVLFVAASSTAAGCSGDCSADLSNCPYRAETTFCGASDGCTVDGAPAICDNGRCTFDLTQKLTIPLEKAKITSDMPDLLLDIPSLGDIDFKDVLVTLDGVLLHVEEDVAPGPYLWVKWTRVSDPKTLEIAFAKGTGPVRVSVSFADVECQNAANQACPGDA